MTISQARFFNKKCTVLPLNQNFWPTQRTKKRMESQKAHQFNLSKSYEIGHFREISYEWNPPECGEGNLTTEYPVVSFIIVFHNEARSALLRTICMGYINLRWLDDLRWSFLVRVWSRDIYSFKVSILETVPNWIVGEIILIDDASDQGSSGRQRPRRSGSLNPLSQEFGIPGRRERLAEACFWR